MYPPFQTTRLDCIFYYVCSPKSRLKLGKVYLFRKKGPFHSSVSWNINQCKVRKRLRKIKKSFHLRIFFYQVSKPINFAGHSTLVGQTSLSEAADAILGVHGGHGEDHRGGGHPSAGHTSSTERFDASPGAVAKNLLGKFTMRKASILSISSMGSFQDRKSNSSVEELYPNGNKSKYFGKKIRREEKELLLKLAFA